MKPASDFDVGISKYVGPHVVDIGTSRLWARDDKTWKSKGFVVTVDGDVLLSVLRNRNNTKAVIRSPYMDGERMFDLPFTDLWKQVRILYAGMQYKALDNRVAKSFVPSVSTTTESTNETV